MELEWILWIDPGPLRQLAERMIVQGSAPSFLSVRQAQIQ